MEPSDSTKAIAVGDSLYVRLPAQVCKALNIKKGDPILICRSGKRIIYSKKENTDEPKPGQNNDDPAPKATAVCNDGNDQAPSPIGAAALGAIRYFNSGQPSEPERDEGDPGKDGGSVTAPVVEGEQK